MYIKGIGYTAVSKEVFPNNPFCIVPMNRGAVECVSESLTSTLKESPTTSVDSENTQT